MGRAGLKAIILAGGPAKQLRYVMGRRGSRSLLRFPSGRLLERHVAEARRHFDNVIVVSDDAAVGSYCRSLGCEFVEQQGQGVEAAICSGISRVQRDEFVTIIYSDIYASKGFISTHISSVVSSFEPTITVTRPLVLRGTYLRLTVDPVNGLVEKTGSGHYVYAGILSLPASLIRDKLCNEGASIEKLIGELVNSNRLRAVIWIGKWVDVDTVWDYLASTRFDLSDNVRDTIISSDAKIGRNVVIEGPVVIEKDAIIDHGAVIKGPVYIGKGAFIGAHSFVRHDTAIYSRASVGAYSEVKRSILYDDASVSSFSYIADSIIGHSARVLPYTLTENVPYEGASGEVVIMSTHPLERLKVGSIIAAGVATRARETIPPASIYLGPQSETRQQ